MNTIENRLCTIERQLRFWKGAFALVLLASLAILLMGAEKSDPRSMSAKNIVADSLVVRELHVVNKSDHKIFTVQPDAIGSGTMHLNDEKEQHLLVVGQGDFGQMGLAICGKDSTPVAILRQGDEGGGTLKLLSQKLIPVVVAGANKDGEGEIVLASKDATSLRKINVSQEEK